LIDRTLCAPNVSTQHIDSIWIQDNVRLQEKKFRNITISFNRFRPEAWEAEEKIMRRLEKMDELCKNCREVEYEEEEEEEEKAENAKKSEITV
jgi:hypothetical protein